MKRLPYNRRIAQFIAILLMFSLTLVTSSAAALGDWSTYLADIQHKGANPDETILSSSNANQLTKLWSFQTGGAIASQTTIVGNVAYFGSWDGYEYAIDASTGALKWKTYLGKTDGSVNGCLPPIAGVTSSATVLNGVVYVGGGDTYWYALDASTGNVLWKLYTGDNNPLTTNGGHYNWSSPLIYQNYAYIGIASFGDCPLVQGLLLKVDLTSHQIVNTFKVVPDGQVGGGIWTSPALDAASNTIFIATGTTGFGFSGAQQPYTQALISLDATTLAAKGVWQVPWDQGVSDGDFGTSPIILNNISGKTMVYTVNKNGKLYGFDDTNITVGPIWQSSIATGGSCPTCGDGSVSTTSSGGGRLYQGGGVTTINSVSYAGSIRAVDPTNGNFLWEHGFNGNVIAATAYANGLVFGGAGKTVYVLDASNGQTLFSYTSTGIIYGAPSISNGHFYAGSVDGNLYAFGLSGTPTPTNTPVPPTATNTQGATTASPTNTPIPPTATNTAIPTSTPIPNPTCPAAWTCTDIGNPSPTGSQSTSGNTWTVSGSGADIWNNSDQFRYVYQPLSGDGSISVRVVSQTTTDIWAKAGIMVRENLQADSAYYFAAITPGNGVVVQYRTVQGSYSVNLSQITNMSVPIYLKLDRSGNIFTAYTSPDGINWTAVSGSSIQLTFNTNLLEGLAVTSHNWSQLSTVVFDSLNTNNTPIPPTATPTNTAVSPTATPTNTAVSPTTTPTNTPIPPTATNTPIPPTATNTPIPPTATNTPLVNPTCPAAWTCTDIGNPSPTGSQSTSGNTWTVSGSGADIWNNSDQFRYVYQSLSGDGSISVRVVSQTISDPWAKAGLMFRDSTAANGVYYYVAVTPNNGVVVQYRATAGNNAVSLSQILSLNTPIYLRVQRAGNVFTAFTSTDGINWVLIPNSSLTLAMSSSYLEGLAVTSHNWTQLSTVVFDSLNTNNAPQPTPTATNTPLPPTATPTSTPQQPTATNTPLPPTPTNTPIGQTATSTPLPPTSTATSGVSSSCPTTWTCTDIGNPSPAGSQSINGNTWTINGSGADIWFSTDLFRYVYNTVSGNITTSVRVVAQTNTDPWAKAGVMFRNDTSANSAYYFAAITPGNGVNIQYRNASGTNSIQLAQVTGLNTPIYLKIQRASNLYTAYTSNDGVTWTLVPGSSVTITNIGSSYLKGLAVTSHSWTMLGSATFDNIK